MTETWSGMPRVLDLAEAAQVLSLPTAGVAALVGGGYLEPAAEGPDGPRFALGDLRAFLARNAREKAEVSQLPDDPSEVDPQALLDALDGRAHEMARRTLELFTTVFPEAVTWDADQQHDFIVQAERRFEAILAVTELGDSVDDELLAELAEIGAAAARDGAPLPQLLTILRISRDLVVQTAVEVAEEEGRHWGLALALLLNRVLPAIDRLTDPIGQGYWGEIVRREEEARARHENLVERTSDGVYEVDLDGRISYANEALARMVGLELADVIGRPLNEVMPLWNEGEADPLLFLASDEAADGQMMDLEIRRHDDVRRILEVRTVGRHHGGSMVGYQGIARDITANHELDARKNEFLRLITQELRQPLSTVLGLGVTLSTYADELPTERVSRIGRTIHLQAERMSRLADDLQTVSLLESSELLLAPRPALLAPIVEVVMASLPEASVVLVDIPEDLEVMTDPRRLEQVVGNLVENAFAHGRPPVELVARRDGHDVRFTINDHGPGVPAEHRERLFTRLGGLKGHDPTKGTGIGLWLVRGLVEAMGGRIEYVEPPFDGAGFCITLPAAGHPG